MDLRHLPSRALELWLRGARLPLSTAEAVLKRGQDTSSWPPSVAFERFEATAKGALARLTGDDQLLTSANLQRAEVAKRDEALAKAARAAELRSEADRTEAAQEQRIEAERDAADARQAARAQQQEQAKAASKQRVRTQATAKKAATRKQAQAATKATDRSAKQAEQRLLREEAAALRAKEAAVEAEGDVLDLDAAVRAKKARRQAV